MDEGDAVKMQNLMPDQPPVSRRFPQVSPARLLFALGVICLLASGLYIVYTVLNSWLLEQDRYLGANRVASLSAISDVWAADSDRAEPSRALASGEPSPPIQIRIPSIGVNRSVIELPLVRDAKTGRSTRDVESLLRSGRKDLVGHWGGSPYPGQVGNTILVGHNYGYGRKGVFVRLDEVKLGAEIRVVTQDGTTHVYKVQSLDRVKWQKKDAEEMLQHGAFLATTGPERLTLVTCGGSEMAPFPERIYVVALPEP
jgi:LPXTG-site transpeptidase (sortase) family protein